MRHIDEQQVHSALRRGASIEQMLTHSLGDHVVRWFSARPNGECFALRLHQVHDDGDADFLDVHEFQPVDEEEEVGEGRLLGTYPSVEAMLEASVAVGGRPDRWVNAGVIQDEYGDLRTAMQ